MDQRRVPSPRLMPLPPEHSPELKEQFEAMRKNLGFIPNSIFSRPRSKASRLKLGRNIWRVEDGRSENTTLLDRTSPAYRANTGMKRSI